MCESLHSALVQKSDWSVVMSAMSFRYSRTSFDFSPVCLSILYVSCFMGIQLPLFLLLCMCLYVCLSHCLFGWIVVQSDLLECLCYIHLCMTKLILLYSISNPFHRIGEMLVGVSIVVNLHFTIRSQKELCIWSIEFLNDVIDFNVVWCSDNYVW